VNIGNLNAWLNAAQILGLLFVAVMFTRTFARAGGKQAQDATLAAYKSELEVFKQRNDRLEADARACKDALSKTQGMLEQISRENESLRQLIMGEKVPQALADLMQDLAQMASTAVTDAVGNTERRIIAVVQALGQDLLEKEEPLG
jgi:uncharacterized membrane-anchored protein YjiN (DUF445 family)